MKNTFYLLNLIFAAMAVLFIGCDNSDDGGGGSGYTGALVTADNLSRGGVTLFYSVAECYGNEGDAIQVGSSGANQSWTFSEYDWFTDYSEQYVHPDSTPYAAVFPDADRAEGSYSYYDYEQIRGDGCYEIGEASPYDTTIYQEPRLQMRLPLKMGTEWNLVISDFYAYYGDTAYWQDSIAYSADAWGTVMTPYDTCICVRVFAHEWFSYQEYGDTYREEYVGYFWFDENGDMLVEAVASEGITESDFHLGYFVMRVPEYGVTQAATPDHPWDRGLTKHSFRGWFDTRER